MKTFFCNRTVDKSEMKRLIKWVLLNYGTQKATRFVDHLKTLGFHSATTAGISLGIDDLRIPPVKSVFLKNAEKDILDNDIRYTRGQITAVERLEKALDIWNTTNDTLKNAVIAHFRETDIFNPVYIPLRADAPLHRGTDVGRRSKRHRRPRGPQPNGPRQRR